MNNFHHTVEPELRAAMSNLLHRMVILDNMEAMNLVRGLPKPNEISFQEDSVELVYNTFSVTVILNK